MSEPIKADDTVYTPDEIAAYAKCSATLVRREINAGRLKGHRLGGRLLRVKGREVHAWLEKQLPPSESTALVGSNPESSDASSGHDGEKRPRRNMPSTIASIVLKERQRRL